MFVSVFLRIYGKQKTCGKCCYNVCLLLGSLSGSCLFYTISLVFFFRYKERHRKQFHCLFDSFIVFFFFG